MHEKRQDHLYAHRVLNELIFRIPLLLRGKVCIFGSLAKTLLGIEENFNPDSDIDLYLRPDSTYEDIQKLLDGVGIFLRGHRIHPTYSSDPRVRGDKPPSEEDWRDWGKSRETMICGPNYRLDLRKKSEYSLSLINK